MKSLLLLVIFFGGCAQLQTPTGQAVLSTSQVIAKTAVEAAATTYGGPLAGQLAGAGLDALATVVQGYINKPVPTPIVKASPGVAGVGSAVAKLLSNTKPVTQTDVNILYQAAKDALK